MQSNSMIAPRLSVMMFLQFFVWGAWYVTAYLYLGKIGFGGPEIGWTYSVGPIAGMISPFFVGMIADRFFSTEKVLATLHLAGGVAMFAAVSVMQGESASPTVINSLFFVHMLCYFPTLALTNSLALQSMTDAEKQFPLIRVFGTIGWIVAGVFVSLQGWDAAIQMFQLAAGASILMGVYCFTLPHTPPPSAGQPVSAREILGLDALILLKNPAYLTFMVSSFLVCIPLAFYYQMAGKFVDHAGQAAPAFTMSFGQMSEIIFMILMPLFFRKLGVKWMLFVGMLAWVARYALFAVAADSGVAWAVLTGIILHGICYDFFFVTGQIYTDKVAPESIRSQAQGMLVLFTLGLGMFIGAQVAGRVEDKYTPENSAELTAEAGTLGEQMAGLQDQVTELQGMKDKSKFEQWKNFLSPAQIDADSQAKVDTLSNDISDLRAQRSAILLKSVGWKSIWTVPALGAFAIMILFALVFREDPEEVQQEPQPAESE